MDNLTEFEKTQIALLNSIKSNTDRSARNLALWTWLIILIPFLIVIIGVVFGVGISSFL